jgi:hypothetical protein
MNWGPVLFATLVPLLLAAIGLGLRASFRVGSFMNDVTTQLRQHTHRLEVLETAALEGPGKARDRRRMLEDRDDAQGAQP